MEQRVLEPENRKKAIRAAFTGDEEIYKFYDPSATVNRTEDIVTDIYRKVLEYGGGMEWYGLYEGGRLIGYYVFREEMLVSFGLSVYDRTGPKLKRFFSIMHTKIGDEIICFLYSQNKRAIKWLQKMGMEIEGEVTVQELPITKLKYRPCQ